MKKENPSILLKSVTFFNDKKIKIIYVSWSDSSFDSQHDNKTHMKSA